MEVLIISQKAWMKQMQFGRGWLGIQIRRVCQYSRQGTEFQDALGIGRSYVIGLVPWLHVSQRFNLGHKSNKHPSLTNMTINQSKKRTVIYKCHRRKFQILECSFSLLYLQLRKKEESLHTLFEGRTRKRPTACSLCLSKIWKSSWRLFLCKTIILSLFDSHALFRL